MSSELWFILKKAAKEIEVFKPNWEYLDTVEKRTNVFVISYKEKPKNRFFTLKQNTVEVWLGYDDCLCGISNCKVIKFLYFKLYRNLETLEYIRAYTLT